MYKYSWFLGVLTQGLIDMLASQDLTCQEEIATKNGIHIWTRQRARHAPFLVKKEPQDLTGWSLQATPNTVFLMPLFPSSFSWKIMSSPTQGIYICQWHSDNNTDTTWGRSATKNHEVWKSAAAEDGKTAPWDLRYSGFWLIWLTTAQTQDLLASGISSSTIVTPMASRHQ